MEGKVHEGMGARGIGGAGAWGHGSRERSWGASQGGRQPGKAPAKPKQGNDSSAAAINNSCHLYSIL